MNIEKISKTSETREVVVENLKTKEREKRRGEERRSGRHLYKEAAKNEK